VACNCPTACSFAPAVTCTCLYNTTLQVDEISSAALESSKTSSSAGVSSSISLADSQRGENPEPGPSPQPTSQTAGEDATYAADTSQSSSSPSSGPNPAGSDASFQTRLRKPSKLMVNLTSHMSLQLSKGQFKSVMNLFETFLQQVRRQCSLLGRGLGQCL